MMKTLLIIALLLVSVVARAGEPPFHWIYAENKDEMRGTVEHTAGMQSTNQVFFEFPYNDDRGSSLLVMVRDKPGIGKDVMLIISKGQFHCEHDGCTVLIKFDDEKPRSFEGSNYSGGTPNALHIGPYKTLVQKLKKYKKMTIEAPFFQAGRRQFTFALEPALVWQY
jgi:hypothetical protein